MSEPIENKPAVPPAAAPAAPAAPPKPAAAKPAPKAAEKAAADPLAELSKGRRRLVWALIWGFGGVNLLMLLRFFFPRALFEPKTIFSIGNPADFVIGVDTKFQKDYRIWVVRNPSRIFVVYARCTHLGCTPDWKQSEQKFKCPCHGSGYDTEGVNFEGPAPRPMDRAQITLSATGEMIVDTGKLYVQDLKAGKDEFDNSGAYLAV